MPRTRSSVWLASPPTLWPRGNRSIPFVAVRRYDRKWLSLFTTSSGENRFWGLALEFDPQSRPARHGALIVSDTLVVDFIDAHPGVPSPYGQLSEAAPPRLEAPQGSEAQTAETGTRPTYRVGAVHRHRRAARVHGGPRAHGLRRHLHRAPSTVLATVAPGHPERHRRCPGIRGDAGIPHVSQGTLHGIPVGSDLRACDG